MGYHLQGRVRRFLLESQGPGSSPVMSVDLMIMPDALILEEEGLRFPLIQQGSGT